MKKPDLNLKASIASLAVAVTVGVLSFNSSPAEGVDSPAQDPADASGVHPIFTGVDVTGDADIEGEVVNSAEDGGSGLPVLIHDDLEVWGDFTQYDGDLIVNGHGYFRDGTNIENSITNNGENYDGAVKVEDNLDVSGYLVVGIDLNETITNRVKIYKDGIQSMVENLEINTDGGGKEIILGRAAGGGEQSNDTVIRGNLYDDGGNLSITDNTDIEGDVLLDGDLDLRGVITNGSGGKPEIVLDGVVRIINRVYANENLVVAGDIDAGGDVDITGGLNVDGYVTTGKNLGITGYLYDITDTILNISDGLKVDGTIDTTGSIKFDGVGTDYIQRAGSKDTSWPVIVDDGLQVNGKLKAETVGDFKIVNATGVINYQKGIYTKSITCGAGYVPVACHSRFATWGYKGNGSTYYFAGLHMNLTGTSISDGTCTAAATNNFGYWDDVDIQTKLSTPFEVQAMCFAPNKFDNGSDY